MKKYEALYIIQPSLDEAARDALIERFSGAVAESGGTVSEVNKWGMRKLAYEINFKNDGFYVLMNFESAPSFPAELERLMRISDDVLRFMVIAKDE